MGRFIDFLLAKPPRERDNINKASRQHVFDNQEVMEELKKLTAVISSKESKSGYKGIEMVLRMLHSNCVGQVLIDEFVSKTEKECTITQLNDTEFIKKALKKFFEKRLIEYHEPRGKNKQRKIILVGPTGAGKTTTLFKIITLFQEKNKDVMNHKTQLRAVNFDNHKIGSKESFDKIVECMEIEGDSFIKMDDLMEYSEKADKSEILLVDTTGKNPKNKEGILEITRVLEPITSNGEVFLVVPANIGELDLRYIFKEFSLLKYDGVIITKLDETLHPATILGICMEFSAPIVCISRGKSYSGDFFIPTKHELLKYFQEI